MSGQQTFVFTDIEDSTGRASRLGDGAWSALLFQHNEVLAEVVASYEGREVKKTGDGAMLVFDDATTAVLCAADLQARLSQIGLPVRAGVHCGPAIDDGAGDFIGMQVHVAARVGALAAGGELLVSAAARHQIGTDSAIRFGQPRTVPLRGVPGLHRVYPVVTEQTDDEVQRTALVGRATELACLSDAFDRLRGGTGGSALVVGEPGAGKSRLVQELVTTEAKNGGVSVHWGHCWDREGSPAYLPWMEIIRSLVATGGADLGHADLAHILPELSVAYGPPPQLPVDADGARARLFGAVIDLVRANSGRQPVLVVLEDLHRSDVTSLELLRLAVEGLGSEPVLFLATTRDTDPEVWRQVHEILGSGDIVKLAPLNLDDIAEYLSNELGQAPELETVRAVAELTECNAFNLTQIAPLLHGNERAALPSSVGASIRKRLESLSPDASWLLEVAATLGTTFSLTALGRCSGFSPSVAITALDEASNARLVLWESPSDSAAFAHQLLQKAMYERIPTGQRAVLHGQVARTLGGSTDPDNPVNLGLTAYHYVQAVPAGFADQAITTSRAAATSSSAIQANAEAVRYLKDALGVFDAVGSDDEHLRLDLLTDLAHVTVALGRRADAHALMESVVEPAMALGYGDLVSRALLGWPADWLPAGDVDSDILEQTLSLLPQGDGRRPALLAMQALLGRHHDAPEWPAVAAQAWVEAEAGNDPVMMADVLSRLGAFGPSDQIGTRLIELGTALGDHRYVANGWRDLGYQRFEGRDAAGAEAAFLEQMRHADLLGAPLPMADARWRLAGLAVNRGDDEAANGLMAEASALEQEDRDRAPRLVGPGLTLLMTRNAGRWADLGFLAGPDSPLESMPGATTLRTALALIGLAVGQPERARVALAQPPIRPFFTGPGQWRLAAAGTADLALCVADSDVMKAMCRALDQAEAPLAVIPATTGIYAHRDEIIGRCAVALGDTAEGLVRLERARTAYTGLGAVPLGERIDALIALVTSGDLSDDLPQRCAALAIASRLPAAP